ncbi:MAG: excinuclease ABC subunit UvrC [Deltaproteobacteria bacterium]|nr:excinuclease ABC subunit UvrC [Deltaproteobacteria bacterium]
MDGDLDAKVRHAPKNPGVYLMKAQEGEILYVGKARNLRARIRAYFARTDSRAMIPFLVSRIRDVEFIITETEKEALILENNLIKEYRPRYNVDFRDDKSYYQIRIDPAEPYARFQLVRRPKKDGARYFGPYPSSGAARETLRFLQTIFPLRSCRDQELQGRRRPCLEYEIGRCTAPCVGRIEADAYERLVRDGIAFLEGRERALIGDLRDRMNAAADALRFEEAAALRDRIAAVEATIEKQRIVSATGKNRDVFGLFREEDQTQISALFVRSGRVIGQKVFPLIRLRAETAEILSSLLARYYDGVADVPDEIVIPEALEDEAVLADWLSEKRGRGVAIVTPKRGETLALLGIAIRNAESALRTARLAADRPETALPLLAEKLKLHRIPNRIECFDISNIGGQYAVGSLVAFVAGLPFKDGYRRFRIRTVPGADDYAMMYEVLKRRYESGENLPDLIMVDGGKGQLGVALAVLKDLAVAEVEVIALAKERDDPETPDRKTAADWPAPLPAGGERGDPSVGEPGLPEPSPEGEAVAGASRGKGRFRRADTPGKGEDRVFLPGRKDPVYLSRWPAALFLLQRIRDEAHRFAVSYYRKVKEKEDLRSLVDRIPGIGATRRRALLTFFGDVKRIQSASLADLQQVEGIGAETAGRIRSFLDSFNPPAGMDAAAPGGPDPAAKGR